MTIVGPASDAQVIGGSERSQPRADEIVDSCIISHIDGMLIRAAVFDPRGAGGGLGENGQVAPLTCGALARSRVLSSNR
jgi:hypothetical protein